MELNEQYISDMFSFKPSHIKDGDYWKDNIPYCGKCNTPKGYFQDDFGGFGKTVLLKINCKCEGEKFEQAAKQKLKDYSEKIKLKLVSDEQYLQMTFDKADGDLKFAQNYVEAWEEIKNDKNAGLLLFGDTGTGKTFAACCIGNALLDKGARVMISNIADLINEVGAFDNYEIVEKIKNCDLLILDDYGATRETEFANEQAYKIIDIRYRTNKPMIITTNLTPEIMLNEENITIKRAHQRVIERCRAVPIKGNNRRLEIAKESRARLDKILKG